MIKPSFLLHELNQAREILNSTETKETPRSLFEPIEYIFKIGGKRIRPAMVLAAANLFKQDNPLALQWAKSVETFHNFSLMHDDIMDDASLRRGMQTVHEKYDVNTAILSGDMMLIRAYQLLSIEDSAKTAQAFSIFNKMAEEVCKGQQLDVDFETQESVKIEDYIQMITWKTSVLLAASLQLGALLNDASPQDQFHLYEFGKNIGIAFQIQDDLLDTFGLTANVGKRIGGDILQNKKTYLYLKSLELLSVEQAAELNSWYQGEKDKNQEEKITEVTKLFNAAGVKVYAEELKSEYKNLALSHLDAVQAKNETKKQELKEFSQYLVFRAE